MPVIQGQASCLAHIPTASERPANSYSLFVARFLSARGRGVGKSSERKNLQEQLHKVQEEPYHLQWRAQDVAEHALQEVLKQAEVPASAFTTPE